MATLNILDFNNYYNRIIKKPEDIAEDNIVYNLTDFNFNPNDGIETEVILGSNMPYDGSGNYAEIVDSTVTHWWIIEQVRTRSGQYRISLRRDVVADYYDVIIESPCFIEKATLGFDNPLIFNNENMAFNQIKTSETAITDNSKVPWVTFYLDRSVTGQQQFTIPASNVIVNGEYSNLEAYPYFDYCNLNTSAEPYYGNYTNLVFGMNEVTVLSDVTLYGRYVWNSSLTWIERRSSNSLDNHGNISSSSSNSEWINTIRTVGSRYTDWYQQSYSYTNANTALNVDSFLAEQGKLYFINGKYYRVNISNLADFTETVDINRTSGLGTYYEAIKNNLKNPIVTGTTPYVITYTVPTYTIELVEETYATYTLTIPESRTHCADAPYDVLCMPCGDIFVEEGSQRYRVNADIAYKFAAEIGKKANTQVFDIQLLPYCPLDDAVLEAPSTSISTITPSILYTEGTDYFYVKQDNTIATVCFSISSNKFRKFLTTPTIARASTAIERKVNNECDMYRLCSPNYDGVFEFSAEKNDGVSNWVVNATYKPYTPYICISPMFSGLYGRNFNDSRGLICGGEFSLPRTTEEWQTYELNNKNYQRAFDRQIENLEFNNSIARTQAIVSAATGTLTGAAAGGMTASMIPGVSGALGAGVGAAASLAGGIADIAILNQQQKETLDYTKDQFGYQLGNIKALPHVLNKIGAFDITNKIFPFVEYFTATEVEKEALRDKIKYNGMTVMTIGTINEYLQTEKSYIKGKLIRCEGIRDDYHVVLAIAEELNKGVFI